MTRKQIARGFVAELEHKPVAQALRELAALIITQKLTNQTDLLVEEIRMELERVNGHVSAKVITARPLSVGLKSEISNLLKQKTAAKTVSISNIIDESVIGGFIAKTAQFELDASVKGKLSQLKGVTK